MDEKSHHRTHEFALNEVESIPRDNDGPVFSQPWEAEVFALAITLHEQGLFTWKEWAASLGQSLAEAINTGNPDNGDTYYRHWLNTLEHMVIHAELGNREQLSNLYEQWDNAAQSTPHGQPIQLGSDDT